MSQPLKVAAQGMRELIAFRIGDQEFCINVMSVREIRGWTPATGIPYAPPYVLGVINLRGVVLPIMDLSARLGMRPSEPSVRHVIIVTQVRRHTVGLLVEAVSDILTINEDIIQPTPEMASDPEAVRPRDLVDRSPDDLPDRTRNPVPRHRKPSSMSVMGFAESRQSPDEVLASGEYPLTRRDLMEVAAMIYADAGISLNETKASLVYSRLSKHIRNLGISGFREYCQLVSSPAGAAARRKCCRT